MPHYDKINRKTEALKKRLNELSAKCDRFAAEHATIKQALDSTLHEVRRLSGELSSYSEHLSRRLEESHADPSIRELCDTIFFTSGMIASRLAFTDLELNPAAVRLQVPVRSGVYKKFEKASHVLALKARLRHVSVQFRGASFLEINALPSFELLPFVLLDNAIKYSPAHEEVLIRFDENPAQTRLQVDIRSLGPLVEQDELDVILARGIRGRYAERSKITGDGRGLFLAKFLCDYHGVRLSVASDYTAAYDYGDTRYAPFIVRLTLTTDLP